MISAVTAAAIASVATIIVAGIGFIASYKLEKLKRRGAMSDLRRKAYAAFFTGEALMQERIDAVCGKLVGFPRDPGRHESLSDEIRLLTEEVKVLVTSLNEVFLSEKSGHVRDVLSAVNETLLHILGNLDFAARHYEENLRFHRVFGEMTDETLATLPEETRAEFIATKNAFEKHDATCPFKSDKFRRELLDLLHRSHELVTKLHARLGGAFAL